MLSRSLQRARTWSSDWRLHLCAVIAVAAVPRLVYLYQIRSWPFFHYPILDSRTQWKWAGILLQTSWIGNPEVLAKAPLYAYFLALNQWMWGSREASLYSAHLLQLLAGAATCGLTYLVGRRVYGTAVGLIAGLLLASYSPGIYREGQLLDTALATLLATSFLLLALSAFRNPEHRGLWFASGLVLGLLGLSRPNLLLLGVTTAVCVLIWFRRDPGWRRAAGIIGLLALGVVLPIAPITGRNYVIARRFVPISATGGINFYTGNNPHSNGYSPIPSGIAWERTWHEAMFQGKMNSAMQDAYWRARAVQFLRDEPRAALGLFFKKSCLFWNAYEIPNNVSYQWGRERSSLLRAMPLTFAVVGPLGLLGMLLGGWRSRETWLLTLFVVTQMLAVCVFFVAARYRMPILPALSVLAAFAGLELVGMLRAHRFGLLVLSLTLLAGLALFVNSDAYGVRRQRGANRDWYYLGQSHVLAQDYESAKDAFRSAAHQHPDDADAYALLGQAQVRTGDPEGAARSMRRALQLAPDFTTTAVRLADLHIDQGWPLADVEQLLRTAVEHQPRNALGQAMLARLTLRLGDHEQAKRDVEAAVALISSLNPRDTRFAHAYEATRVAFMEADEAGIELSADLWSLMRAIQQALLMSGGRPL